MNNTLLATAFLTILSAPLHAENPVQPAPANTTPTPTEKPVLLSPPPGTASVSAPKPAPVIDCNYRIPADTSTIDQAVLSTWAQKAAVKSFEFNPTTIDSELAALKPCYTDQGWQGYNDALQKSGNITAIKSQRLTVSSQVDGNLKINAIKDNQWKISIPMQIVYQNDKEKLTQLLLVDLLIGRKITGDLGIMQMIATPRQPMSNSPSNQAPNSSSPTTPPTNAAQPGQ